MGLRVTILGCGSSGGVPRLGGHWGDCDPAEPRNRRRRCSLLLEQTGPGGTTRVLIDTSPDMRDQLLDAGVGELDAVVYTHSHADHTHGIDDLRAFTIRRATSLPLYGEATTLHTLRARFPYIMDEQFRPLPGTTRPEGTLMPIQAGVPFLVKDTEVLPIAVPHGHASVVGYRVGDIAYITDAKLLPDTARAALSMSSDREP